MTFIDIISISPNEFVKRYYITKGGKKEVIEESCSRSDYFDYIDSLEGSKDDRSSSVRKTAVEWLVDELKSHSNDLTKWHNDLVEQAKEMEKRQIIDAFNRGEDLGDRRNYTGTKYYKENFKGL